MSEIVRFDFQGNPVQVFMIDGKPWWLANEVCTVLGYKNPVEAVKQHVSSPDRALHAVRFKGQMRQMWIINKSGLMSLILDSQLPKAKEFRHWVTSEVLPSIMETGGYIDPGASTEQLDGLKARVEQLAGDKQAAIMREAKERKKALAAERKANRNEITRLEAQVIAREARGDAKLAEGLRDAEVRHSTELAEINRWLRSQLEAKQEIKEPVARPADVVEPLIPPTLTVVPGLEPESSWITVAEYAKVNRMDGVVGFTDDIGALLTESKFNKGVPEEQVPWKTKWCKISGMPGTRVWPLSILRAMHRLWDDNRGDWTEAK